MDVKIDWLKNCLVTVSAHYIPGPLAGFLLKSMGARVIKIEPPFGDYMRGLPPFFKTSDNRKTSAFFCALNAGVESVSVNLKSLDGVMVFKDILEKTNVFIDGNRPGYIEKTLGCKVSEVNPDCTHICLTAFGLNGPYKNKAGHDGNCLAIAGTNSFSSVSKRGLSPMTGIQADDIATGYMGAMVALGAIVGRNNPESSCNTKIVDTSMLDNAFFLNQLYLASMQSTGKAPIPDKELLNGGMPYYCNYGTSDGREVFFGPIEPKLYKNFCNAVNRPDLLKLRNENKHDELSKELTKLFKSKTRSQWMEETAEVDCCLTSVNSLKEAVKDPQIIHRGLFKDPGLSGLSGVKMPHFPAHFDGDTTEITGGVPEIGQHTSRVLKDMLGYTKEKVESLLRSGTVVGIDETEVKL